MKDEGRQSHDALLAGIEEAFLRASWRVRERARLAGTKVVICRDGQVLFLDPDDPSLNTPNTQKPERPRNLD